MGIKVKSGEIKSIDYVLDKRIKILEPEIVDALSSKPINRFADGLPVKG